MTAMKFKVKWSEPKKFEDGNFKMNADGVYLIGYRDTQTHKRFVVYVGQGDIASRLADHFLNNACVNRRIGQADRVGYYRYAECSDEDDRMDIEFGLYHNHGGEKLCNEVEPAASGRYEEIEIEEKFA